MKSDGITIYQALRHALNEESFRRRPVFDETLLQTLCSESVLRPLAETLASVAGADGRFYAPQVLKELQGRFSLLKDSPDGACR